MSYGLSHLANCRVSDANVADLPDKLVEPVAPGKPAGDLASLLFVGERPVAKWQRAETNVDEATLPSTLAETAMTTEENSVDDAKASAASHVGRSPLLAVNGADPVESATDSFKQLGAVAEENGVVQDNWRDAVRRRSPAKRPTKFVTLSPRRPRRLSDGDTVERTRTTEAWRRDWK